MGVLVPDISVQAAYTGEAAQAAPVVECSDLMRVNAANAHTVFEEATCYAHSHRTICLVGGPRFTESDTDGALAGSRGTRRQKTSAGRQGTFGRGRFSEALVVVLV